MKVKVWERIREERMRGGFVDTFYMYLKFLINEFKLIKASISMMRFTSRASPFGSGSIQQS